MEEIVEEAPNFFKIVVNPKEHLLRIPDNFARTYRDNLPDFIFIGTPDGLSWKIKVVDSDDGDMWLKGFGMFNEYYSINFGYLLIFKYDYESHCRAHIYDRSASEIDYTQYELNEVDKTEDAFSIGKKRKYGETNDDHLVYSVEDYVEKENNLVYQKAKDLMVNSSSLYFISVIHPSHDSRMSVPKAMVMDHPRDKRNQVTLCASGRTWNVECIYKGRVRLSSDGWRQFSEDNRIEVGDACIFIVDKNNKFLWNVTIIRCSSEKQTRPSFFKVLVKDFTRQLSIPPAFIKQHGHILPEHVKLRTSSAQTWEVKFEQTEDDKHCFTTGWTEFVKHVRFGEFLVFWYNGDTSTFDVSVFGHNASERVISSYNSMLESKHSISTVQDGDNGLSITGVVENEAGITERGFEWNKSWPHCEKVMSKDMKSRVCFSKAFAEATGLKGKHSVVLIYPPDERHYVVKMYETHPPRYQLQFKHGWPDFYKAHGLGIIGTNCLFMYNPKKNVIQVKDLGKSK